MLLIGLCGKMGTGKDFVAKNIIIPFLKDRLQKNVLPLSFADQIKVNVISTNKDVHFDDVYTRKTKETRHLLQQEGTEKGRNVFGQDIWLRYFDAWTKVFESRGTDAIVTSDVRFRNEASFIKSQGGLLIKLVAPQRNQARLDQESGGDEAVIQRLQQHSSECDLDQLQDSDFDLIIHNDGEQLAQGGVALAEVLANRLGASAGTDACNASSQKEQ